MVANGQKFGEFFKPHLVRMKSKISLREKILTPIDIGRKLKNRLRRKPGMAITEKTVIDEGEQETD